MRRFRFPLDKLLRLRGQQQRQARRELAAALTELHAAQARIAGVAESIAACEADRIAPGPLSGLASALCNGLSASLARLERERLGAQELVEQRLSAYEVRRREHEALAKLYARQRGEWEVRAAREMQAEMDEVARLRFVARMREENTA